MSSANLMARALVHSPGCFYAEQKAAGGERMPAGGVFL